jgi:glycosyltransferase involved in cell wall biosynthesis
MIDATALPVLSFIAAACPAAKLETMFFALFSMREALPDFEVVVLDDASADGAWEIALAYQTRHPGRIALCRAAFPLGRERTFQKAFLLPLRGKYFLDLERIFDQGDLDPRRIAGEIAAHASKSTTPRFSCVPSPEHFFPASSVPEPFFFSMPAPSSETPLVSILLFNYNYGRYLETCLASVFAQTWQNFEVCFSDNASDDDSWDIALEWAKKHPGRIHLVRNRINYGPHHNRMNCLHHVRGQYVMTFCSDDALHPEYLAHCVEALEKHPAAAFVVVHREIMDEAGNLTHEPPFYDRSCFIPGASQAAVYMMTPMQASISQVFYRTQEFLKSHKPWSFLGARWWLPWFGDFRLCAKNGLVYLKEALLYCRVHEKSDGASLENNLMQVCGQYVMAHQLADIATNLHMPPEVSARLPAACAKHARLSLRYALRSLLKGEEGVARRYFCLAEALAPEITCDPVFLLMEKYWRMDGTGEARSDILAELKAIPNLEQRQVSYEPPPGSLAL